MTAQACRQPGCDGTIVKGSCNVCGIVPAPAPAAAGAIVAGPSAVTAQACRHETIVKGFCSACGLVVAGPPVSVSSVPGAPVSGLSGSGSAGTGSKPGTRGSRRGSDRSSRGALGAGLVQVPLVPAVDPAVAVLRDPRVPENRRFCGNEKCGKPVGRQSPDGQPGLTEGHCPHCKFPFSFTPKLTEGELVHGQYEVLGCLAHGGLGWIYLARDRNLSDRWVVLKGLLDTGDPDAMEAALAERKFLAQVEHPNIVKVHNFVQHESQHDGEKAGYIVMEYVGGKTLMQIREEAKQGSTAVPLAHALAYAIEILPALGYLHDRGLVYCDFKPDNVIQSEEQLKLIDMGGVRYIAGGGAIFGTPGYQAPEIGTDGPSPGSDLYTVGRALALLTFDFDFQGKYEHSLPGDEPLLLRHESFARLLRRATHPDPARRFQSAGEMAEQLTGVLREVLAADDGRPRPAVSRYFSLERRAVGTGLIPALPDGDAGPQPGQSVKNAQAPQVNSLPVAEMVTAIPVPLTDDADPAAGYLATLADLAPEQQVAALRAAVAGEGGVPSAVAESRETWLALVRALIAAGDADDARARLARLAADDPADWRIDWYTGLRELASSGAEQAAAAFNAVYDVLPGELAPKLALGFAAEVAGVPAAARRYHRIAWATGRSFVSAAFGVARACLAGGDRAGAIAAVDAVPGTSSHHAAAQVTAVRLLIARTGGLTAVDLHQAEDRLSRLQLDELRKQELTVEILRAAVGWARDSRGAARCPAAQRILGCEPTERALSFGLEDGYRTLASLTRDPARRIALRDMANTVRPRTWLLSSIFPPRSEQ